MRAFFVFLLTGLVAFCSGAAPLWAAGSGAYRLEVADANAAGKGLAFVGEANNPSAVYYNPAGLTQIVGQAVSVGATLIQPRTTYQDPSGNKTQMHDGNFVIPNLFYAYSSGSFALGMGVMSSWGLTTEWQPDSFARYCATKSVMTNQNYLIAGAYQVSDQLSLAVGLDIDDAKVDKQKKFDQSLAGWSDGNVRLDGTDTAFGYRIAGMFKLNERHQFGLMYRSRIRHEYEGKVKLENISPGYQAWYGFPASSYETGIKAKVILPESIAFGYSYKPNEKWTFNTDMEWMNWSVSEEEYVDYSSEADPVRRSFLDAGNPSPLDWRDALSFALGGEYKLSDRLRLRAGYYHHQTPIPAANWAASLPDSDSNGITAGFGYDITRNMTLDMAWSGLFYKERKIENTVAGGTISGTYRQWCNLVYATLGYHF